MSNKLTPKLRFPEFESEWGSNKIEGIAKVSSGGTPDRSEPKYWNGKIPWITTSLIDFQPIQRAEEFITEEGLANSSAKIFDEGTILMAMYGQGKTRGKVGVLAIPASTNQACAAIQVKQGLSNYFIFHLLAKDYHKIRNIANDGGQQNLSSSLIKSLTINLPSLPEQLKIATFLTSIDARIQLLERKKAQLEAYKKGVMQQLFSQRLRFKKEDGSEFPEWEEKRLGEVLDYEQPTKYLVESTEYNDSYLIPVLTAGKTFLLGYTDENHGVFEEKLPTIIFDDFTTAFQFVDFPFKAKSSAMKMLIPKDDSVNLKFVFEAMTTIKFPLSEHKRYWISEFQHQTIPYPSPPEQRKIASFLGSLDAQIESVGAQIGESKEFKRGLLQNMFV